MGAVVPRRHAAPVRCSKPAVPAPARVACAASAAGAPSSAQPPQPGVLAGAVCRIWQAHRSQQQDDAQQVRQQRVRKRGRARALLTPSTQRLHISAWQKKPL